MFLAPGLRAPNEKRDFATGGGSFLPNFPDWYETFALFLTFRWEAIFDVGIILSSWYCFCFDNDPEIECVVVVYDPHSKFVLQDIMNI